MKKMLLFMFLLLLTFNVEATSGSIKQSSVIKCGNKYYGSHGNPKHWHIVEKKNDKWVSVSETVDEPSCYGDITNVKEEVTFNKCVDGDTIRVKLDGEVKTVRFLAIDTPESVHPKKEVEAFGKEASDYTCKLVSNANKLYLEYDKNSEREDKYGRLLAFVYADDVMLQKALIQKGYARVAYLYADYTHTNELQALEKVAKNKKVGIWGDSYQNLVGEEVENGDINSTDEANSTNDGNWWDKILSFFSKVLDKLFKFIKNMV